MFLRKGKKSLKDSYINHANLPVSPIQSFFNTMYTDKEHQYYPSAPPPPPQQMSGPAGGPNYYPYPTQPPPAAFQMQSQTPSEWSTGLCGCTEDCGNCWMTCCCPCVTFGRVAEITDRGSTSCGTSGALYALLECFTCCHWIYSCVYRSKMRAQYNLGGTDCGDCLLHFCCEPCALCQEYRELKNQGFDMKIGWHANMEKQAQKMTQPPVTQGGMMR